MSREKKNVLNLLNNPLLTNGLHSSIPFVKQKNKERCFVGATFEFAKIRQQ